MKTNKLRVDYISDLHMGFIIGNKRSNQRKVKERIEKYLKITLPDELGDVLVIAGDVDEYNSNIIHTFEEYAKYYNKIFYVFGNHDLYLMSGNQVDKYGGDSRNRQEELKQLVNDHKGLKNTVTILDNDVVNYKDVTIAGTMSWYTHPLTYDKMWWSMNSNDSRKIYPRGQDNTEVRHDKDMEFYKSLDNMSIDLLITHVPPIHVHDTHKPNASYHNVAISEKGLYAKHWICGHQHTRTVKQVHDTTIYVNASGYPKELAGVPRVKSFYI